MEINTIMMVVSEACFCVLANTIVCSEATECHSLNDSCIQPQAGKTVMLFQFHCRLVWTRP